MRGISSGSDHHGGRQQLIEIGHAPAGRGRQHRLDLFNVGRPSRAAACWRPRSRPNEMPGRWPPTAAPSAWAPPPTPGRWPPALAVIVAMGVAERDLEVARIDEGVVIILPQFWMTFHASGSSSKLASMSRCNKTTSCCRSPSDRLVNWRRMVIVAYVRSDVPAGAPHRFVRTALATGLPSGVSVAIARPGCDT